MINRCMQVDRRGVFFAQLRHQKTDAGESQCANAVDPNASCHTAIICAAVSKTNFQRSLRAGNLEGISAPGVALTYGDWQDRWRSLFNEPATRRVLRPYALLATAGYAANRIQPGIACAAIKATVCAATAIR